jgi:hypothetical protein
MKFSKNTDPIIARAGSFVDEHQAFHHFPPLCGREGEKPRAGDHLSPLRILLRSNLFFKPK